ncbi:MAG: 2,3-diphosphoglycerate-dependent phosphoglycerate mutase [Acidimicrobiales bacterium]
MSTLILLRHGESEWNARNLFTGWHDADLSEKGRDEARAGGRAMAEAGLAPDVLHTSLLIRAIRTAQLALEEMSRPWVEVRRSWRLNEWHYGGLTGLDKKATTERYGAEQVFVWRRSYDTPPPPLEPGSEFDAAGDPRYAWLAPDVIPRTECLKDVVARMLPYWHDSIVPDLRAGRCVLVAAHGNSLRALVKHLDRIGDDEIAELNLPTGAPIVYELGADLAPAKELAIEARFVGDVEAAKAAAAAVARQAG